MTLLRLLSVFASMLVLAGCFDATLLTETATQDQDQNSVTVTDVTLYWSAPVGRINGDSLSQSEIGGYEIRYKQTSDSSYTSIIISDSSVEQYSFHELENIDTYSFEVAAFDTDGVYSDFVTANSN